MRPQDDPRFKRFGDQLVDAIRAANQSKQSATGEAITMRFCAYCSAFSVPALRRITDESSMITDHEVCLTCNKEYLNER